MPELVKAGKLYKAIAPLYHIDDKKHPFVRDKREYVEIYQDKIVKNYEIKFTMDKTKKAISNKEFKEFIFDVQEYSDELIRIAKHFGVSKFLVELVAAFIIMNVDFENPDMDKLFENKKFVTHLLEVVQKKFPEITLKGKHSLRGVIDGRFQSININNRFVKKVEDLSSIYLKYGYSVDVKEKDEKFVTMSIGEFLDSANKFKPKILTRYKGLNITSSFKTSLTAGKSIP